MFVTIKFYIGLVSWQASVFLKYSSGLLYTEQKSVHCADRGLLA